MRTDFRYTIIMDFNTEDEYSTHLLLSMKCDDETDFDKVEEVLTRPSVITDNLFALLPIIADDLSHIGINTVVEFTSKNWIRKQIFRYGIKFANRKFKKLGREEFIKQFC